MSVTKKLLPKISIITPSFNQVEFLEPTICSVLMQDYVKLEYIIIDGGSTDGSVDIIRKYTDHLAYWVSEPDNGQSAAINKGFRLATGDLVGWLNSNDTYEAETLHRVANLFEQFPEIHAAHGSANWIDASGRAISRPGPWSSRHEFGPHNILTSNIIQPGSFWRREVFDKIGYLDEELHYVMDYEFWTRMVLAGFKFKRISGRPVANHRMTDTAKTNAEGDKMGFERIRVMDNILADSESPTKLGLSYRMLLRQANKGCSMAYLRIAFAYVKREGYSRVALSWLLKAVKAYPPMLFSKHLAKYLLFYQKSG